MSNSDPDDEMRRFLATFTVVLLIPFDFVVYAITRDSGLLAGTTILGIAVAAVFWYYFSPKKGK